MKLLKKAYYKWQKMKPLVFIVTTTVFCFVLMLPIAFLLESFSINDSEIGGIDIEKRPIINLFIAVVIFAPIIETLFFQLIPIKLTQVIIGIKFEFIPILFSSLLFSLAHITYSFWYSLLTLPLAVLLAKTYLIFQKRKESSFLITTLIHSLRNLIGFIVIWHKMA